MSPYTTLVQDGVSKSAATTYDGSGRVASKQYPAGLTVGYSYTGNGYLASVTNEVGGTALWTANQQDAELHLTQETFGNGVVTNQAYFANTGRIQSVVTGSVVNLSYTWDQAGNLLTRSDTANNVSESFQYDALNRLTKTIGPSQTVAIGYDASGNITSKSDLAGGSGQTGTYTYNASGTNAVRPHAVTGISGTVNSGAGSASGATIAKPTYLYDLNGNMVSGGGRTVTYTASNLTATIGTAGGSGTISYEYDASDQRYSQSAPEGTTTYWNAQGVTSEQYAQAGTTNVSEWRNFIVAGGQTIGIAKGSTAGASLWGQGNWGTMIWSSVPLYVEYFHEDHLGSVLAATNASGSPVATAASSYDAWGKRRGLTGAPDPSDTLSPSSENRGFTTQEQVDDIAWVNLNARMYDPQIGKFMSTDPLVGEPYSTQGWNRYAYVGNNPLKSTDPTGEEECDASAPCEIVVTPGAQSTTDDSGSLSSISFSGGGAPTGITVSIASNGTSSAANPNGNGAATTASDEKGANNNDPTAQGKPTTQKDDDKKKEDDINKLINAQDSARHNPAFKPANGVTHCNQATCEITKDVGDSTNPLTNDKGQPLLANDAAKKLATSKDYKEVAPAEAQELANKGELVIAAQPNPKGHGHLATVRPDPTNHSANPTINNIGSKDAVMPASQSFSRNLDPPKYYTPR